MLPSVRLAIACVFSLATIARLPVLAATDGECLAPSWLLARSSAQSRYAIFSQPMSRWITLARPAQRQAIQAAIARLGIEPNQSLRHAVEAMAIAPNTLSPEARRAELSRLQSLLVAVGTEWQLRGTESPEAMAALDRCGEA